MTEEAIPLDKLARVYRKLQHEIDIIQAEADTKIEELKAKKEVIKNEIKDRMLASGSTSTNTPGGTIILSIKKRFSATNWDAFGRWIIDEDAVQVLEHRIHQSNMAQWLTENPGKSPPGLNTFQEYDISVRKPKS